MWRCHHNESTGCVQDAQMPRTEFIAELIGSDLNDARMYLSKDIRRVLSEIIGQKIVY